MSAALTVVALSSLMFFSARTTGTGPLGAMGIVEVIGSRVRRGRELTGIVSWAINFKALRMPKPLR